MKKIIVSMMLLGSISTNAQKLLEVLMPYTKADVWDRTHYLLSFSHNGAHIDGVIDNTNNVLTLQIPYNQAIINRAYNAIEVEKNIPDREGTPTKLTLHIPAGVFKTAKGFLTATIRVGNGTTDVYRVKHLNAFAEELLTTFSFRINGNIANVRLIASGGVLDKKFNIETNGELEHQFIYAPVSAYPSLPQALPDRGSPYEGKWLNNNLGANYAKVGNNQHHKQAETKTDHNAYGYLYEWRRDSDGHEIINWTSATQGTFKHDMREVDPRDAPRINPGDPCPTGYSTPEDEHALLYIYMTNYASVGEALWEDKSLNLPAAGFYNSFRKKLEGQSTIGHIWSTIIPQTSSNIRNTGGGLSFTSAYNDLYSLYRTDGASIRCVAVK